MRARIAFVFAVAATTLWILAVGGYVDALGGLNALAGLPPSSLMVVIASATGPLAALWLVMAVLEQRRALGDFARRMGEMTAQNRQSLQQAEVQARTLMQLQAEASRTQALETRRLALQDMAASAGVLAERLGVMDREAANAAWMRYGAGDVYVFVQSFLSFAVSHPDIAERMAEAVSRDAVAGAALAAFVRRYERLASITNDKLAAEIFDDGALGRAFRLFKSADEQAARMLAPASAEASLASEASSPDVGADAPDDDLFARRRLANLSERLQAAEPAT